VPVRPYVTPIIKKERRDGEIGDRRQHDTIPWTLTLLTAEWIE
jgi:hypothetical protein